MVESHQRVDLQLSRYVPVLGEVFIGKEVFELISERSRLDFNFTFWRKG